MDMISFQHSKLNLFLSVQGPWRILFVLAISWLRFVLELYRWLSVRLQ